MLHACKATLRPVSHGLTVLYYVIRMLTVADLTLLAGRSFATCFLILLQKTLSFGVASKDIPQVCTVKMPGS